MRSRLSGSDREPEFRNFPRFIVPLLLFLIVVLLGSLVWLQYEQRQWDRERESATADRTRNHRPAPLEDPWPPFEGAGPEHEQAEERRKPVEEPSRSGEVSRSSEHRRLPPPASEPPAPEAEPARDSIDAALESALDRGGIEESLANPKNPWNVRVVWLEPPLADRGLTTPQEVKDHYCGEAASLSGSWVREVVPLGRDGRPVDLWLLVGRVEYTTPPLDATRRGVVEGLGGRSVVNAGGWFVLRFTREQWREHARDGLKLRMPGYRLNDKDGLSPNQRVAPLAPDPFGQPAVTLTAEPAPAVALGVRYKPRTAMALGLRAWLEVFNDRAEAGRREVGLFIESDVPRDGMLTFLFPDPATWTDVPVKLGAVGEGWSSGPPVLLENFRGATPRDKLLRTAINVELERASTELVTGRVREYGAQYPLGPVRVESVQTGVRTVTDNEGGFRLWVVGERSDWDRLLRVDPLFMTPLQFAIDNEEERPPNVSIEPRGVEPVGPWLITIPSRAARSRDSALTLFVAAPTRISALFSDGSQLKLRVMSEDARGVVYYCENWIDKYSRLSVQLQETGVLVEVRVTQLSDSEARDLLPGARLSVRIWQLVPQGKAAD